MGEDNLPVNCPSQTDIRTVASWLAHSYPMDDLVYLLRNKDYTAAHELAGVHEAITALRTLADDVEAKQRDEELKEEIVL